MINVFGCQRRYGTFFNLQSKKPCPAIVLADLAVFVGLAVLEPAVVCGGDGDSGGACPPSKPSHLAALSLLLPTTGAVSTSSSASSFSVARGLFSGKVSFLTSTRSSSLSKCQ